MADVDSRGRGDVKTSAQPSISFVRPNAGEHPHTSRNPYGDFQHTLFDTNYDHSPYASFNAGGSSSGSGGVVAPKFIHPFMLERFIDSGGNIRTRVYGGKLNVTFTNIVPTISEDKIMHDGSDFDSSTAHTRDQFATIIRQDPIDGITSYEAKDDTGGGGAVLEAFTDNDGNETVHTAYEFPLAKTHGSFYLSWTATVAANNTGTVTIDPVQLHHAAGAVADDTIGLLGANNPPPNFTEVTRADRVGTYYAKLGESYDPTADGTGIKSIKQVAFNHIYWAASVMAEST